MTGLGPVTMYMVVESAQDSRECRIRVRGVWNVRTERRKVGFGIPELGQRVRV